MERRFKGVIFDMDGTLLDTIGDVEHCANLVLGRYGFPPLSRDFYGDHIHEGDENFVKKVLLHFGEVDGLADRVLIDMRREYESHCDVFTKPFEQIRELLTAVRDLGLKTAVLSNKEDGLVKGLARKMFPDNRFEEAIGTHGTEDRKPNPENALKIASSFEAHPSEVIMLGDSRIDMLTAAAAGMSLAGALWGYGSAEELDKSGAEILIGKPLDLLPHLK
jgi:phosphoglycolate phosphatase